MTRVSDHMIRNAMPLYEHCIKSNTTSLHMYFGWIAKVNVGKDKDRRKKIFRAAKRSFTLGAPGKGSIFVQEATEGKPKLAK